MQRHSKHVSGVVAAAGIAVAPLGGFTPPLETPEREALRIPDLGLHVFMPWICTLLDEYDIS